MRQQSAGMNACLAVGFLVAVALAQQPVEAQRFAARQFVPSANMGPINVSWRSRPERPESYDQEDTEVVPATVPAYEELPQMSPVRRGPGPLEGCEDHKACRERLMSYFNNLVNMKKAGR
ncbi:hypothetical protein BV898_15280 [Hypsibius exemplaris]|uniref:Uncharacterized protein n=1 Tax=Hypsibius exemplaris TaxID=2072580 RepID=A0A9X6NCC1_HYPEX|nr:hypothetical protein BV898_15280 [Hypsibius exemplaris]